MIRDISPRAGPWATGFAARQFVHPRLQRQRAFAGAIDVEDDDVIRCPRHAIEARLAAVDRFDDVALVAEHAAQRAADAGFVVDNEDGGFHVSFQLRDPSFQHALARGCCERRTAA